MLPWRLNLTITTMKTVWSLEICQKPFASQKCPSIMTSDQITFTQVYVTGPTKLFGISLIKKKSKNVHFILFFMDDGLHRNKTNAGH